MLVLGRVTPQLNEQRTDLWTYIHLKMETSKTDFWKRSELIVFGGAVTNYSKKTTENLISSCARTITKKYQKKS